MEVTYIDHMGNDDRVVNAARVSFHKLSENYTEEQNDKLIIYLAKHGHFTPFTHPQITLREKVPIFVARQRFKHTIGFSYNEISRRYVDDTPEFYVPDVWRGKPVGAKQGSSDVEISGPRKEFRNPNTFEDETAGQWYEKYMHYAKCCYQQMIEAGVAPEQARMVLPQSMYTEYYCTGSLYAWARAYKLRIDPHSQKEIRNVAVEWDRVLRPLFSKSWSALVD